MFHFHLQTGLTYTQVYPTHPWWLWDITGNQYDELTPADISSWQVKRLSVDFRTTRKTRLIEDRGQTDRVTAISYPYALDIDFWPGPMILSFNPRWAIVMIHLSPIQPSNDKNAIFEFQFDSHTVQMAYDRNVAKVGFVCKFLAPCILVVRIHPTNWKNAIFFWGYYDYFHESLSQILKYWIIFRLEDLATHRLHGNKGHAAEETEIWQVTVTHCVLKWSACSN